MGIDQVFYILGLVAIGFCLGVMYQRVLLDIGNGFYKYTDKRYAITPDKHPFIVVVEGKNTGDPVQYFALEKEGEMNDALFNYLALKKSSISVVQSHIQCSK